MNLISLSLIIFHSSRYSDPREEEEEMSDEGRGEEILVSSFPSDDEIRQKTVENFRYVSRYGDKEVEGEDEKDITIKLPREFRESMFNTCFKKSGVDNSKTKYSYQCELDIHHQTIVGRRKFPKPSKTSKPNKLLDGKEVVMNGRCTGCNWARPTCVLTNNFTEFVFDNEEYFCDSCANKLIFPPPSQEKKFVDAICSVTGLYKDLVSFIVMEYFHGPHTLLSVNDSVPPSSTALQHATKPRVNMRADWVGFLRKYSGSLIYHYLINANPRNEFYGQVICIWSGELRTSMISTEGSITEFEKKFNFRLLVQDFSSMFHC